MYPSLSHTDVDGATADIPALSLLALLVPSLLLSTPASLSVMPAFPALRPDSPNVLDAHISRDATYMPMLVLFEMVFIVVTLSLSAPQISAPSLPSVM